jgi:hypothetical protein
MSLGLWPDAVPYDDEAANASEELRKHFDAAKLPSALLLVCSRGLRGSPWAAKAAVGLARALAGGSRTVVLADLDFENPSLHDAIGEPNVEGLADALLFGASLERVTTHPAGESFEFVSSGGFAPDPLELLMHPGWTRLLGELSARNAMLLAYAPLGIPGLDGIGERITSVIVLAAEDALAPTVALLPESIRLEGVIRPPHVAAEPVHLAFEPVPEPAAATGPATESVAAGSGGAVPADTEPMRTAKDEARAALMADLRARQNVAGRSPESEAVPDEGPIPAPVQTPRPAAASTPRRPIRIGRPRWGVIGAIAVLAAAGFLIGKLLAGGTEEVVGTTAPISAGGPAQPAGVILNYSVAVEAYDQLPAALARADSLALLDSALTFYIAPVLVAGNVWYRVMAGPLSDSASAAAALNALVSRGLKAAANEWDLRSTPLAFFLGRFASRDSAVQRMRELRNQGVPTYVVVVPYSSGPDHYHLYGGAYSADSEAAVMRDLLRRTGLTDTLTLRLGRGLP